MIGFESGSGPGAFVCQASASLAPRTAFPIPKETNTRSSSAVRLTGSAPACADCRTPQNSIQKPLRLANPNRKKAFSPSAPGQQAAPLLPRHENKIRPLHGCHPPSVTL
jgi:hypothetical protein